MRKKYIIGWILFVAGVLLQVVAHMVDILIIHIIGGTLWSSGVVMGVNAAIALDRKKKCGDSPEG